jgi:hypothetical protein
MELWLLGFVIYLICYWDSETDFHGNAITASLWPVWVITSVFLFFFRDVSDS